ncbi:type I restriction-modification system subunit M N-terminal domain-containing protein [uncultured Brevundimonas sp.]
MRAAYRHTSIQRSRAVIALGASVATLTQSELERHLWQAADILCGHVDAGKFKDYIFALLFYRRLCDVGRGVRGSAGRDRRPGRGGRS